jgi:hypothetical protein
MADILIVAPSGFPEAEARQITHICLQLQDTTPADLDIEMVSLPGLIKRLAGDLPGAIVLLSLDLLEEAETLRKLSNLINLYQIPVFPVRDAESFLDFEYRPRPDESEARFAGRGIPYNPRNLSSMN